MDLQRLIEDLNAMMVERYPVSTVTWREKKTFINPKGIYFALFALDGQRPAVGVEYALNEKQVRLNFYEDGDVYFPDELSVEEIYRLMCTEIDEAEDDGWGPR